MKETINYRFLEFGKTKPRCAAFKADKSYLMVRVILHSDNREIREDMAEFKGWEIERLYFLRDKFKFRNLEPIPARTTWRNLMNEL